MTILTSLSIPILLPHFVAQAPDMMDSLNPIISEVVNFVKALLILVIGWIVASMVKGAVKKLLKSTDIDNKIAAWVGGQEGTDVPIENWIADIACWLIRLFAVGAFLNALQLDAISEPLNQLLGKVTSFLPQLLGAAVWLGLAWVIATLSKIFLTKTFEQFNLDQRLGQVSGDNQLPLSQTISNAVYWFIFLLFLPGILSTLQLEGTLVPVQSLLDDILGILPNVFGAIILGGVGWVIAQIVRQVVTNLLIATGVDQLGTRFGLTSGVGVGGQSLSQILGSIVYILVLIPTAIIALDALQINSISDPATEMLNQVLALLPKLFAATVILGLAYVAGQYLSQLVSSILASVGFNNLFHWLGIAESEEIDSDDIPTLLESGNSETSEYQSEEAESDDVPIRTPSQIAGVIVLVAVMLIATLTAVDILQISSLKTVVAVILAIAGQVFVGLVVFAIGLYLSNLAYNLITSSNTRQSKILGYTARIAILVLVSAMALQQMGIAPNIVNLAFGLLMGGISVAIALAFGLGGRDVAGEQLRSWITMFNEDND